MHYNTIYEGYMYQLSYLKVFNTKLVELNLHCFSMGNL